MRRTVGYDLPAKRVSADAHPGTGTATLSNIGGSDAAFRSVMLTHSSGYYGSLTTGPMTFLPQHPIYTSVNEDNAIGTDRHVKIGSGFYAPANVKSNALPPGKGRARVREKHIFILVGT